MLSIKRINNADYYAKLATVDYFNSSDAQIGEPKGVWSESIKRIGGTSLTVENDALTKLMSGYSPDGKKLTRNAGSEKYRSGMDLTFSMPKSASIVFANADETTRKHISLIQRQAVIEAMQYLESKVETRIGTDGHIREKVEALIYATFEHCTSREVEGAPPDMQLHTHCVVSNAAIRKDGQTGAIENSSLYIHKMAAGAKYRSVLAREFRKLGLQVELDERLEGSIFRVAGVDPQLEKHFSKRRSVIKEKAEEFGVSSAISMANIAEEGRNSKNEINRKELFEGWQAECESLGYREGDIKKAEAKPVELLTNEKILEQLTEKESYFEMKDIERVVFEQAQFYDFNTEARIKNFLNDPKCVRRYNNGKVVYTSKDLIELEKRAVDVARYDSQEMNTILKMDRCTEVLNRFEKTKFKLKEEQRAVFFNLTCDRDGVGGGDLAILEGLPGTGKTTVLNVIGQAFRDQGYQTIGTTISAKAGVILTSETGIETQTTAMTLEKLEKGDMKLDKDCVIFWDEASLADSRSFAKMQTHINKARANGVKVKLVMCGDTKQLSTVGSGAIYEALLTHAEIAPTTLTDIRRQKNEKDLEASYALSRMSEKPEQALENAEEAVRIYKERGRIISEADGTDIHGNPIKKPYVSRDYLMQRLAEDYVKDPTKNTEKMVLVSTNAEAHAINQKIRRELFKTGALKENDKSAIIFENEEGHEIELQPGDRVFFKKNNYRLGVNNGVSGTVIRTELTPEGPKVIIKSDDLGEIKSKYYTINVNDYKDLKYGMAMTTMSSQGSTFKNTRMLFNKGVVDQKNSFVAMTRHKDDCFIYCTQDDEIDLAAAFSRERFKGTTLDLEESLQVETPEKEAKVEKAPEPTKKPTKPKKEVLAKGVELSLVDD